MVKKELVLPLNYLEVVNDLLLKVWCDSEIGLGQKVMLNVPGPYYIMWWTRCSRLTECLCHPVSDVNGMSHMHSWVQFLDYILWWTICDMIPYNGLDILLLILIIILLWNRHKKVKTLCTTFQQFYCVVALILTFDLDKWYIHDCLGHYPAKLLKLFLFLQIVFTCLCLF